MSINLRSSKSGLNIFINDTNTLEQLKLKDSKTVKDLLAYQELTRKITFGEDILSIFLRDSFSHLYEKGFEIDITSKKYSPSTLYIEKTVRSGETIENEGDIIVKGDVNPGAYIISGGNIIILGFLRGIAKAGIDNLGECFIYAERFNPLQVSIGEIVARSGDAQEVDSVKSGLARVINEKIVIL